MRAEAIDSVDPDLALPEHALLADALARGVRGGGAGADPGLSGWRMAGSLSGFRRLPWVSTHVNSGLSRAARAARRSPGGLGR